MLHIYAWSIFQIHSVQESQYPFRQFQIPTQNASPAKYIPVNAIHINLTYNENIRDRIFFLFAGRFRLIHVPEVWIIGTVNFSAKHRFSLCLGSVYDSFHCIMTTVIEYGI